LKGTYWHCPSCGGGQQAAEAFAPESISHEAIRCLCVRAGREVQQQLVAMEVNADLVGSCDGTMVPTREEQWRKMKA